MRRGRKIGLFFIRVIFLVRPLIPFLLLVTTLCVESFYEFKSCGLLVAFLINALQKGAGQLQPKPILSERSTGQKILGLPLPTQLGRCNNVAIERQQVPSCVCESIGNRGV